MSKQETKNYMEVEYVVIPQKDESFIYKVTKGLEPFEIVGSSKRSLTIEIRKEIEKRLQELKNKDTVIESEEEEVYTPEEESEIFSFDNFSVLEEEIKKDTPELPLETDKEVAQDIVVVEESSVVEEEIEEPEVEEELPEEPKEISPLPKETYPKFPPRILEMDFVVVEGQFFGAINDETFVTIKNNVFIFIQSNLYYAKAKGQTRRKMNVKIVDIPLPELDTHLLFRFLVCGEMWSQRHNTSKTYKLGKSKGSLVITPHDCDENMPMFLMDSGIMATSDFMIALLPKKSNDDSLEVVTKRNYTSDKKMISFNGSSNIVFDKSHFDRMKIIIGERKYKMFIANDRVGLLFQDIKTENFILCSGENTSVEEESEEDV